MFRVQNVSPQVFPPRGIVGEKHKAAFVQQKKETHICLNERP